MQQGQHWRPGQALLSYIASHFTRKSGFHGIHAKLQPKLIKWRLFTSWDCMIPFSLILSGPF